jgi:hypothetical protein
MKRILMVTTLVSVASAFSLGQTSVPAPTRVESNVIYGMHSGLALLMDVHYAETPNGYGIVFIPGSGWHSLR